MRGALIFAICTLQRLGFAQMSNHPNFRAANKREPPTGNEKPARIKHRSTLNTLSKHQLVIALILNSDQSSGPLIFLTSRDQTSNGRGKATNALVATTSNPARHTLSFSSSRL